QLLRELLLQEDRGLFLELHFLDLRARRIELLLRDKPGFFRRTKRRTERFHRVARDGERLFRLCTSRELSLQRFLDRRPINRCALDGRLRTERMVFLSVREASTAEMSARDAPRT